MAWEKRVGGRYFYKSVRRNGRVKKVYYGRGPAAELAARIDADARERRAVDVATLQAMSARFDPVDGAMAALDAACSLAVEATLVAAGYRRINYEWK
jgi:hypothetical protein